MVAGLAVVEETETLACPDASVTALVGVTDPPVAAKLIVFPTCAALFTK